MPCSTSSRNMASVCDQSYLPGLGSTIPHGIITRSESIPPAAIMSRSLELGRAPSWGTTPY